MNRPRVLEAFPDARLGRDGWYLATCPAHADEHPSLGFREMDDGWVAFKCRSQGCSRDEILHAAGLTLVDIGPWQPPNNGHQPDHEAKRWRIGDWLHIRYEDAQGHKTRVPWADLDGVLCKSGMGPRTSELPLYGVELLADLPDGAVVYLVEGERTADALRWAGLVAVGTVTGAAGVPCPESLRPLLRFRVMLWPDNDDQGSRHMQKIAARLAVLGCQLISMVRWPEAPEKGDAADLLRPFALAKDRDGATAALEALAQWTHVEKVGKEAADFMGGAVRLSDVEPESVEWLWHGRIARGKLTLIDGDPGLGKSLLTLDISARLTTGAAWPDGQPCPVQGSVLLLGAEDGLADTVRPRLDAAGADVHHVYALPVVGDAGNERQPSIPDDLASIEAQLVSTSALMLVVDPLMAFLGGDVNSHRDQDVRRALAPLAAMADRLRVAVVVVRHLNKSSGAPAIYRGGGSIGLAGAARIVLAVGADPEDETRRVLAPVKANLSAPAPSLAYRLTEAPGAVRIEWLGASTVTAGQLLAAPVNDEDRSAMDDAVTFLRDRLADGWVEAATATREATRAGISVRTLKRAKTLVSVVTERKGFGSEGRWFWSLPESKGAKKPIEGQSQEMAPNGQSWHPMTPDDSGARVY